MTAVVADSRPPARARLQFDLLGPLFCILAVLLAVLVVLPLAWLLRQALVDDAGHSTLANFAALVTDTTLRKPFLVAIGMALSVGVVSCAVATPLAWLVARTDLPGRRLLRALVAASFVTPPFLG